jgi:hypothetical protein
MTINVRVTKTADLDEDIVEVLLDDFIDWLDEHGLLREGQGDLKFEYNNDLVKAFIETKAT